MIEIVQFRPFEKNTLRGFLTVRTPAGWEIHDICVHQKGAQRWLTMPAKPVKKETGETVWFPIIRLAERERWEAFQKATLAALDAFKPPAPKKEKADDGDIPF